MTVRLERILLALVMLAGVLLPAAPCGAEPMRAFVSILPQAFFVERVGGEQVAVESEGKAPGPKRLADLIDMARAEGIRVIFVQPQYSKKSARTIAEAISGAVVPLDPLARDYLANLRRMAETVREGLSP